VGFAVTGAPQDPGYSEDTVEVHAIYQLREVARTGVARRMMVRALDDVRAGGFRLAILWVLATNARARRFYERGGWRSDGRTRTNVLGRIEHSELRYHIDLANSSSKKAQYNKSCVGQAAPLG
jgi:ribosomal protein S18 acetylase RimI-like enzyme